MLNKFLSIFVCAAACLFFGWLVYVVLHLIQLLEVRVCCSLISLDEFQIYHTVNDHNIKMKIKT